MSCMSMLQTLLCLHVVFPLFFFATFAETDLERLHMSQSFLLLHVFGVFCRSYEVVYERRVKHFRFWTNSKKQGPYPEANTPSTVQRILHILYKSKERNHTYVILSLTRSCHLHDPVILSYHLHDPVTYTILSLTWYCYTILSLTRSCHLHHPVTYMILSHYPITYTILSLTDPVTYMILSLTWSCHTILSLTRSCHLHDPVTYTILSLTWSCHLHDPVTYVILSHDPVTYTILSLTRSCHLLIYTILSLTRSCHTILSLTRSCHLHDPVTYTILSHDPVTYTILSLTTIMRETNKLQALFYYSFRIRIKIYLWAR